LAQQEFEKSENYPAVHHLRVTLLQTLLESAYEVVRLVQLLVQIEALKEQTSANGDSR